MRLRVGTEARLPDAGSRFLRHTQLPQQIAAGFPHHRISALQGAVRTRVGPGRNIDRTYTLVLQQSLDAEHVICVTDGDATVESVGPHDHSHPQRRLSRVGTLRLSDQAALRDSLVL